MELNPPVREIDVLSGDERVTFLPMEAVWDEPDLSRTEPVANATGGFTRFRNGDLLLPKITPTFEAGRSTIACNLEQGVGFGTTELHVLRPHSEKVDTRYLLYQTKSRSFLEAGAADMYGVAGQKRISEDFVKDFRINLPALDEQRAIVRLLDEGTARIDALIERNEKLKVLLEDSGSIVLDTSLFGRQGSADARDSGVEWLGVIPVNWDVRRAGLGFRERDDRGEPDLPALEVSLNKGVVLREFFADRIERVASDLANQKIARKGDLVFNKMRMWQGAVGTAPEDGLVSTDYTVAVPTGSIDSRYAELVLKTPRARTEIDKWSHGMVRDRNRLYWDGFKNIFLPVPPMSEQREILARIDADRGRRSSAVSKVDELIERLAEYRSALITAAVNGEIDVGSAA